MPPVPDSPVLVPPVLVSPVLVPPVNPPVTFEILELIWSAADLSAPPSPPRDLVPFPPTLPGTAMLPSRVVSVASVWPAFVSALFGTAAASAGAPVAAGVMD